LQNFQGAPALKIGAWNDMEIRVKGQRYTVFINGQQTTDFTNPRSGAVVEKPGLPLKARGLTTREDPLSGYLGIQAHTGNVAFANIRIKRS
jgi:hypothetical protein